MAISAAVVPQARDETGQCVRRRRDGLWGAKARCHPPQEGPQGTLGVVPSPGGEAQGDGDARRPGRTRRDRPVPPDIVGGGHPPSQLQKCCTRGHRVRSVPIALRLTKAGPAAMPSMVGRATPAKR